MSETDSTQQTTAQRSTLTRLLLTTGRIIAGCICIVVGVVTVPLPLPIGLPLLFLGAVLLGWRPWKRKENDEDAPAPQ